MIVKYGLRTFSKTQVLVRTSAGRCQQASSQRPFCSAASPELKENSSQKWHLTEPSINIRTEVPGKFVTITFRCSVENTNNFHPPN